MQSETYSLKVVYAEEEHGRSIVAARDVKPGEVLVHQHHHDDDDHCHHDHRHHDHRHHHDDHQHHHDDHHHDHDHHHQVLIKATPLAVGPRMHNPTPTPLPCLGCYKVPSYSTSFVTELEV